MVTIATVAITIPIAGEAGAALRALGLAIEKAAAPIPDKSATGASTVLTISDAPATGVASVQITGGPFATGPLYIVG